MKHRFGIGFFAALLSVAVFVTAASYIGYQRARERTLTQIAEKETETQESSSEASAQADAASGETALAADGDADAMQEGCFYLMEANGYVIVCLSDKKTVYEYTDILVDDLPELVQTEIKNGKYIATPEELYGFLEGYSS